MSKYKDSVKQYSKQIQKDENQNNKQQILSTEEDQIENDLRLIDNRYRNLSKADKKINRLKLLRIVENIGEINDYQKQELAE